MTTELMMKMATMTVATRTIVDVMVTAWATMTLNTKRIETTNSKSRKMMMKRDDSTKSSWDEMAVARVWTLTWKENYH